jgi:hypothetical protein
MSFAGWQKNKWLTPHKSSAEEIAALLAIVQRDLANAKVAGLADDWKFNIATTPRSRPRPRRSPRRDFALPESSTTTGPFRA